MHAQVNKFYMRLRPRTPVASFCSGTSSWDITIYTRAYWFYWDVINECHSEATGNRVCFEK